MQVKPIVSAKPLFDVEEFEKQLDAIGREAALGAMLDYKKTVATWKEKPTFTVKRGPDGWGVSYDRRSKLGERYGWIDYGTKARGTATAKPGRPFTFRVGGFPKTKPNFITSYKGKPGVKWVSTYKVKRKGIRARNFTKIISARRGREFRAAVKDVIRESKG
jgi:hypothetical protein